MHSSKVKSVAVKFIQYVYLLNLCEKIQRDSLSTS
jgi:hypothetical protein